MVGLLPADQFVQNPALQANFLLEFENRLCDLVASIVSGTYLKSTSLEIEGNG